MPNATALLDNLVPVSQFNHGGASKAFSRVGEGNPVVVLKNNEPTAVIITPDDYKRLTEAAEDFALLQEATARLNRPGVRFLTEAEAFKDAPLVDDGYKPEFE